MGSDHLDSARRFWDGLTGGEGEFAEQDGYGRSQWAAEPNWGDWSIPESQLRLLPAVAGLDAVELGCGTAYVSGWLARSGARPVGVDASERQLSLARRLQRDFGVDFPLVRADAECLPCADGSFDLAVSEYGASTWCDPHRWVPEAARVLRPGGRLVFLIVGPLLTLCSPEDGSLAGDRLLRDYFGLRALRIEPFGTTDFQLPYGEWIRVLRRAGFVVEDLAELRPRGDARSPWPFVDVEWARRWPSECIWSARKAADAGANGRG